MVFCYTIYGLTDLRIHPPPSPSRGPAVRRASTNQVGAGVRRFTAVLWRRKYVDSHAIIIFLFATVYPVGNRSSKIFVSPWSLSSLFAPVTSVLAQRASAVHAPDAGRCHPPHALHRRLCVCRAARIARVGTLSPLGVLSRRGSARRHSTPPRRRWRSSPPSQQPSAPQAACRPRAGRRWRS